MHTSYEIFLVSNFNIIKIGCRLFHVECVNENSECDGYNKYRVFNNDDASNSASENISIWLRKNTMTGFRQ